MFYCVQQVLKQAVSHQAMIEAQQRLENEDNVPGDIDEAEYHPHPANRP